MASPSDVEQFRRLDAAFRGGDLAALRDLLGQPDQFPNVIAHPAIGACLTYAIYHSPISLVKGLLDAGADPNWPSDDGFPPLLAALSCVEPAPGSTPRADVRELIETLLQHGADVNQRGLNDYTPLHWAAGQGDLAMIELLLAHGADPNAITRIDDMETPLEVAAVSGRPDIVERLRAVTTRLDWEHASDAGLVAELRRLNDSGHDINATDGYGQTALMRAAHRGQAEAVRWLIDHDADLDHTSKFGLSALMLAVIAGHPRIARALADAGADTTIRGSGAPGFQDKTAGDLALARGDRRLAAYLGRR